MIYTASYFQSIHHHGALVPISLSIPKHCKGVDQEHPLRELLAPSRQLLNWWKKQEESAHESQELFPSPDVINEYTNRYRLEISPRIEEIKTYLETRDPEEDETWLCWEGVGEFCHRNLAYKLVEKYRPDCAGGRDTFLWANCNGLPVRHRLTDRIYTFVRAIPENKSCDEYAELSTDDGRTIFWPVSQLELI